MSAVIIYCKGGKNLTDATDISTLETLKRPLQSESFGFQKRSNIINIITGENLFEIAKFDRLLQA